MKQEKIFYRNGVYYTLFEPTGYIANEGYMSLMENAGYYFGEADIIEKINNNEDGYFDFSKSIVDIGSEVGVYSWGTRFDYAHLFEGNYTKIIYSEMNMLIRKGIEHFTVHNILLSDKEEAVPYDGFCTSYSNVPDEIYNKDNEKIAKALPLDYFNLENVGFIKIDTEGMEEKIIRGAIGTIIRNNYPPILFELWPVGHLNTTEEKFNNTKNLIENLGYKILWNWGDWETHLAIKI